MKRIIGSGSNAPNTLITYRFLPKLELLRYLRPAFRNVPSRVTRNKTGTLRLNQRPGRPRSSHFASCIPDNLLARQFGHIFGGALQRSLRSYAREEIQAPRDEAGPSGLVTGS